jgi:hypothetical protein
LARQQGRGEKIARSIENLPTADIEDEGKLKVEKDLTKEFLSQVIAFQRRKDNSGGSTQGEKSRKISSGPVATYGYLDSNCVINPPISHTGINRY